MTNLLEAMAKNWAILSEATTNYYVDTTFVNSLLTKVASDQPNVYDAFDLENEDLEDF